MSMVLESVRGRGRALKRDIKRAQPAAMIIRLVVMLAASAALLLAYPPVIGLQVLIFLPALFPRSFLPTLFMVITIWFWLVSADVDPTRLSIWRVAGLAIALYLVHVGCALAAVLPYDAVVSPGIFTPWIVRAAVVSVLTLGMSELVFAVRTFVGLTPQYLYATIAGLVLTVTIAIFLLYLGKRRQ